LRILRITYAGARDAAPWIFLNFLTRFVKQSLDAGENPAMLRECSPVA
jgi:hypothetical protein